MAGIGAALFGLALCFCFWKKYKQQRGEDNEYISLIRNENYVDFDNIAL